MTHEQYLSIYERERKKSSSIGDAAYTVFKALNREIIYRIGKGIDLANSLHYANTVWQILSDRHNELKPDGFKNLMKAYAEKNEDVQTRREVLRLLEII